MKGFLAFQQDPLAGTFFWGLVGAVGEGRDLVPGAEKAPPCSPRAPGWGSVGAAPLTAGPAALEGSFPQVSGAPATEIPSPGFARPPRRSRRAGAPPAPVPGAFLGLQFLDVQPRDEGWSGGKLNSKWLLEPLGFYS